MRNFKNITATFKVTEDTAFKRGTFHKDRSDFIFEVKRYESGATAYGDRSGHSVEIANHKEYMGHYFDTRYDGITTDKEKWITFWKDWIEEQYVLKVELVAYQEETIQIED